MRLNVHVVRFSPEPEQIGPQLRDIAIAAEEAGATRLTVMDHFFQIRGVGPAEWPMLEGYTTLGYLAGVTSRIQLGLLVGGVTYRHPGLLAKIVATLDVLSRGRAGMGIGAAWFEREHEGLGVRFPPVAERFERLEETLQICQQMWSGEVAPYDGKHYQLGETLCVPPPLHRPQIMIGGGGEQKTLRLVAQYADACNLFPRDPDFVAHKLQVLREHCDRLGRDYDAITKTVLGGHDVLGRGDLDGFVRMMESYAALGIDEVYVVPHGKDPGQWIEQHIPPLIPRLAALG